MCQWLSFRLGLVAFVVLAVLTSAARADLVHWYTFNNGDASDSVGSAHGTGYGTAVAPLTFTLSGEASLGNDGNTQRSNDQGISPPADPPGAYLDLPNGTISALGNQATFETWFTWGGGGDWQRLFDFGTSDLGENSSGGANNSKYLLLTPQKSGVVTFAYRENATVDVRVLTVASSAAILGVKTHLAVTWDGAGDRATVYCNGTAVGYVNHLAIALPDLTDNNNWLGRSQHNDRMLAGAYDEFRIYNEALSPAQMYHNAAAGPEATFTRVASVTAAQLTAAPVHRYSFNGNCDDSIGTADGTLVNRTGLSTYSDGKLTLGNDGTQKSNDGLGDYVDLPNGMISSLEDDATFEAWITWNGTAKNWQRIFDFGTSVGGEDVSDDGYNCTYVAASAASSRNQLEAIYRRGDTNEGRILPDALPAAQGAETHLALVWDGSHSTASLYVDGELVTTDETHFTLAELADVNNWLGRAQFNDTMFVGDFNEFRVYDYALTAGEVLGNYQAGANKVNLPGTVDIPGDADGDGVVDAVDAQALAANWGTATGATWAMGDFSGDGAVNAADASILAANWGDHRGTESAAVPEPSIVLLALGALLCFVVRRGN